MNFFDKITLEVCDTTLHTPKNSIHCFLTKKQIIKLRKGQ